MKNNLFILFLAVFLIASCDPGEDKSGYLEVEIIDDSTGQPSPARVIARGSDDSIYFAENSINFVIPSMKKRIGNDGKHFTTRGNTFLIKLPEGESELLITKGLEYEPVNILIPVKAADTMRKTVRIKRWINMNDKKWYSADHHAHRKIEDVFPHLLLTEELNLAIVQSNWDNREEFLNDYDKFIDKLSDNGVLAFDSTHLCYPLSTEIENREGSLFFHIFDKEAFPIEIDGDNDISEFIELSRLTTGMKGIVEMDKPIYWNSHIYVALANVSLLGLANNHMIRESWLYEGDHRIPRSLVGDYDDGELGYCLYNFDLYYNYLNCGFKLIPVAGSASYPIPNPLGYNRVYVKMDKFNLSNYFNILQKGKCFVTNGPLLTITSSGKEMGDTLITGENSIKISTELYSRVPVKKIELVFNGEIVHTLNNPELNGDSCVSETEIPLKESGWLIARCFEERSDQNVRFAHTAPLYIKREGLPFLPDSTSVNFFISLTDSVIMKTKRDTSLIEEKKKEKIEVCEKTKEIYESLLQ